MCIMEKLHFYMHVILSINFVIVYDFTIAFLLT